LKILFWKKGVAIGHVTAKIIWRRYTLSRAPSSWWTGVKIVVVVWSL